MLFTRSICFICEQKIKATEKIILFGHSSTPYKDYLMFHPDCICGISINIEHLERLAMTQTSNRCCYICSSVILEAYSPKKNYCILKFFNQTTEKHDTVMDVFQTGRQHVCGDCFSTKENEHLVEVLSV